MWNAVNSTIMIEARTNNSFVKGGTILWKKTSVPNLLSALYGEKLEGDKLIRREALQFWGLWREEKH